MSTALPPGFTHMTPAQQFDFFVEGFERGVLTRAETVEHLVRAHEAYASGWPNEDAG